MVGKEVDLVLFNWEERIELKGVPTLCYNVNTNVSERGGRQDK